MERKRKWNYGELFSAIMRVQKFNILIVLILLGFHEEFQLITIATTYQHGSVHIISPESTSAHPKLGFASFCLIKQHPAHYLSVKSTTRADLQEPKIVPFCSMHFESFRAATLGFLIMVVQDTRAHLNCMEMKKSRHGAKPTKLIESLWENERRNQFL